LDNANTATSGATEISIPAASSESFVHGIAINPNDADEILVVLSNYNIVGLYHSSNGGSNYSAVEGNLQGGGQTPGPSLRSATMLPSPIGTIYFVGTSTGIYSTTQLNGVSTVWQQEGASDMGNVVVEYVTSRKSDLRVAAGTHGRGIFTGYPGPTVGVEDETNDQPKSFILSQNYPNPFNPSTTIGYQLPKESQVTLKIYDILGKEAETLINDTQSAGYHQLVWNASNFASGVYLYSLIAKQKNGEIKIQQKKMILLR
jgi:hypothetical protein